MKYCLWLVVLPVFIFSQGIDKSDQEVVDNFKYYTAPGGLYFPSKSHYLPNDLSGPLEVENIVAMPPDTTGSAQYKSRNADTKESLPKSSFSSISQHIGLVSTPVSATSETPSLHVQELIKTLQDF